MGMLGVGGFPEKLRGSSEAGNSKVRTPNPAPCHKKKIQSLPPSAAPATGLHGMQRLLLLLLLLVFLAGTAFYFKREAVVEQYHRVSTWVSRDKGARAPEGEPSPPQRYSRVPPPHPTGEKQYAPPGTFYVIKRKKVTS